MVDIKIFTVVKNNFEIYLWICFVVISMARDPICAMTVDEKTAKLTSEHEGQTFYFCSTGCKRKFDSDPHKYAHH